MLKFIIKLSLLLLVSLTIISIDQSHLFSQESQHQQQEKTVQQYITDLKSKDRMVRLDAVDALGKIGPDAKKAIPALLEVMQDDLMFTTCVNSTFSEMGPGVPEILIKILQDKMHRRKHDGRLQ